MTLNLNFTPFPELTTGRLLLRKASLNDVHEVFFMRSDPGMLRHINKAPAQTLDEAEAWINMVNTAVDNNEYISWAIAFKEQPEKMIGSISLWRMIKENFRAEAGYVLHTDHHNKGIVSEALHAVIDYGFNTINLHSIEAHTSADNIGSRRVLEKCGFIQEAYFKEDNYFNGRFRDSVVYSLLASTRK